MKNPGWLSEHLYNYSYIEDVPQHIFDDINSRLDIIQSETPAVSVVVCAWNEEINVLRTISSLSKAKSKYPFEIVVVNNNSTDRTQFTLDKLHVRSFFQPIQGWGPARQMGLEHAKGKYVLISDADAIYPVSWIDKMMDTLLQPGVACACGRYSYIGERGYPRWQLFIHEKMKDLIAELRHFNRPFLNAYGISMGFRKEHALEIGYVMNKIRGEDGRMCFDLMKYGEIRQVRSLAARVWTYTRSLKRDGTLGHAIMSRIVREINRLPSIFYPLPQHNTKTSVNEI